jgi:hypothetical protein
MASLRIIRTLALLVPVGIIASACGGTVEGGGLDGSPDGKSGKPDATQDSPVPMDDTGSPVDHFVPSDTGGPTDAGPGGIPCGMSTCVADTQECCISTSSGSATCTPKGDCDGGVGVTCSGPESCPVKGDVCCATGMSISTISVSCTTMAACMGFEICQSNMDCTPPDTCQPSPFPGYKYCRRPIPDGGFPHHEGGLHMFDGGLLGDGGILPP